ncbi:4-oxalocrotonate tautomerase family protein [Billgrantia montanilacus]|uniref:Tautomerase n=1 Tax=Billgrantia montanilacus TaxID=2282305 RepID=A0A368TPQ9_9GAMM|nr:4-oxalocrotonate tautomerase family protein [Halomonas montanilacus]
MQETTPDINIRIIRGPVSAEQKAALIEGATTLLVEVLGKNPQTTVVVIDEVSEENWGIAGKTVAARKRGPG